MRAFLLLWLTVSGAALEHVPSGSSYERHVAPVPMGALEKTLFTQARRWVEHRQGVLRWDNRLARAAAEALAAAGQQSDALALEAMRTRAWQQGWTDGELSVLVLRGSAFELSTELTRRLDDGLPLPPAPRRRRAHHYRLTVDQTREQTASWISSKTQRLPAPTWVDMNRVGMAVSGAGGAHTAVVALSRHLVHLAPVPARVEPGAELMLVGRLAGAVAGARQLVLDFTYPDGSDRVAHLDAGQALFEQRLHVGERTGVLQVQVLVDRGYGPEVASQFPLGVGTPPWLAADLCKEAAKHGSPAATASNPSDAADGAVAAQTLLDLFWGARAARGLPRPQPDDGLQRTAQAHADEMQRLHYFAHVSPSSGDVVARLAAAGVHARRALEDLAAASSPDAAFAQWMASPSHRANLLDLKVSRLGLGTRWGDGPRLLAVLVLTEPADTGTDAELTERALQQLNQARTEQGWPPLHEDLRLSAIAQRRSRANAQRGHLGDPALEVETALASGSLQQAASDSYRSDGVDAVVHSTHLAEAFERVGLGVSQSQGPGPRLWITVIYGH